MNQQQRVTWSDLNKRQQYYLKSVFDLDQTLEQGRKKAAERGRWDNTPASEWRWMPYNADHSALLRLIQSEGYQDQGTGSTWEALERRGLVLCKYEPGSLGGAILFVQITRPGRALVRQALNLSASKALPVGTLQEWHWRALAMFWRAGDQGVSDGDWPRGIGEQTIRRLEEYKVREEEKPLIKWAMVPCEPFLVIRWTGDKGILTNEKHVRVLTSFGCEYYRENWPRYRDRYPEVDAPDPQMERE